MFCFTKLHNSAIWTATQARNACLHFTTYLNGLSIDVVVTLKCLYRLAFILSFVVIPKQDIWKQENKVSNLTHVKTSRQVLHKTDWKRILFFIFFLLKNNFCLQKLSNPNIKQHTTAAPDCAEGLVLKVIGNKSWSLNKLWLVSS